MASRYIARVPVSTLRNWEADRGFPNMPALLRLAKALSVRVERLAEGWKTWPKTSRKRRRRTRPDGARSLAV